MRRTSYIRTCSALALALAFTVAPCIADAVPRWMERGKAGPWLFNFRTGLAFSLTDTVATARPTLGTMQLEFGYALTESGNAYVLFAPQLQFGGGSTNVIFPLGFEYDVAVPRVPGLYITPRFTAGYAALVPCGICGAFGAYYMNPEIGVRMVFARTFNVGLVPLSMPMFLGGEPTRANGAQPYLGIQYAGSAYGGFNF